MKKRLVLTIDETNEGKHEITLDDGDMCYGIKFDLNIRYIEKMNAIDIARYMIEVLNNNPISAFCSASRLKEETKPCVDRIKAVQIRERDFELRKEIIAAMIGDASDKDFINRVNSIYNWIKEGKV